jgi:hypothetical protein
MPAAMEKTTAYSSLFFDTAPRDSQRFDAEHLKTLQCQTPLLAEDSEFGRASFRLRRILLEANFNYSFGCFLLNLHLIHLDLVIIKIIVEWKN